MTLPETTNSLIIRCGMRQVEVFAGAPMADPGIVCLKVDFGSWINLKGAEARQLADALTRCAEVAEQ